MFESAGGSGSLWLSNLFGGGGGGASSLGSLGDIGFGEGNLAPGWSSTSGASPVYASGNVPALGDIGFGEGNIAPGWQGFGDKGTDWGKIGKAAGDAAKSIGGAKALPDSAATAPGGGAGGGGGIGRGGGPGLDALVALLAKRREQWMQAALTGEVPKQTTTSGLLGL